MEVWEVVGVDTKSVRTIKTENKQVYGVALFLVGDAPTDQHGRYLGRQVREQFISNERLGRLGVNPMPGDLITIYFNRWGDIEKIDISNSAPAAAYGA